jgi:acylphosphatase
MVNKRLHVCYSGMVQGVGFRYTSQHIASRFGLTGWVRNLRDGGVEVLAEGHEEVLGRFLAEIDDEMGSYIRGADISWGEATGEFGDFEIRFG